MSTRNRPSLYIMSIAVLVLLFVLLVLLPFYGNGIYRQFVGLEAGQDLPRDIQNFAPFSWSNGAYIRLLAIALLFLVPIYVFIMSFRSIWILWIEYYQFKRRPSLLDLIILTTSLVVLLISIQDWWRIGYWLAD